MTFRRTIFLLIPLVLFFSSARPALAGPKDEVVATTERILSLLRDRDMDRQQRRREIREALRARFDFRAMSLKTLGRNWKKASPEQKDRFVELFARLLENAYLGRIEAYTDEEVVYGKEKIRGKKAVVKTEIVTRRKRIPVDYRLYDRGDGWYVYDVIIEEISLIRNYRSSYREIIGKEGFDGLLGRMEAKLARRDAAAAAAEAQ